MDRCANTESLNKYLNQQEIEENMLEEFSDSIYDDIQELKEKAKDFNGWDFSNELENIIKEML